MKHRGLLGKARTLGYGLLHEAGLYHSTLEVQEAEIWERFYPRGRTVLDVGSSFDTPRWFLEHGARKVIAIDARQQLFLDPRVKFVRAKVDAIKIDIEGAEKGLMFEWHYKEDPRLKLLYRGGHYRDRTTGIEDAERPASLWRLE